MRPEGDAFYVPGYAAATVLIASVVVQLLLILHLGHHVYGDVIRDVNFGAGVQEGVISIRTHVNNTKTFLGPMVWHRLADVGGVFALKFFNLAAFVTLFTVQGAIGRRLYTQRVTLVALLLFAFYTGTLRNVAAGEPDDMLASLGFATAILVWLDTRSSVLAGLVMGCAFLFKFWILIFFGGFVVFLLVQRDWKAGIAAGAAFVLPLLCINLVDGGASMGALLGTVRRQESFSSWPLIGWRLTITGLLAGSLVAGWAALRRPAFRNTLTFLLPAPYILYVVAMRDAHAVSFVMMLCLVFWSFPIAELFLSASPLVDRRRLQQMILAAYLIGATGNAYLHLYRDTHTFVIRPGCGVEPLDGSDYPDIWSCYVD